MSDSELMKTLARREFEEWAGSYDRSLLNRFLFRPAYQMFTEELYAWRKSDPRRLDLLDVGCGTGTLAATLLAARMPVRFVGLDYSEQMCREAGNKAEKQGLAKQARFINADSEHLPFADASFDVVTCSNSFHHYPRQQEVIRQMRRVLRPGGRLMLIDGFRDNVVGWVVFDVIITAVEKQVFHAPWTTIHGYFESAGFREVRRRKFGSLFPLLLTVGVA